MSTEPTYITLDPAEKRTLWKVHRERWLAVFKSLGITLLLPVACGLATLLFLNLPILYSKIFPHGKYSISPDYNQDFILPAIQNIPLWAMAFFALSLPIYIIILIANLASFLRTITPVYIDIIRNKKKRIPFHPQPSALPEHGKYFIQTREPQYPFVEVSYNTYINIDPKKLFYLDILPSTWVVLNIISEDGIQLSAADNMDGKR